MQLLGGNSTNTVFKDKPLSYTKPYKEVIIVSHANNLNYLLIVSGLLA